MQSCFFFSGKKKTYHSVWVGEFLTSKELKNVFEHTSKESNFNIFQCAIQTSKNILIWDNPDLGHRTPKSFKHNILSTLLLTLP